MKLKFIYIFLIIIALLLSLSSVCASDINQTSNEVINQMSVDEIDVSQENFKLKDANIGSFTELQNLVNTHDNLNLTKDYCLENDEDSIYIGKNIVINGNGHYIDGNNKKSIFVITNGNVVLNNVELKNGNGQEIEGTDAKQGGAINCLSGYLTINECTIHNNNAGSWYNLNVEGGAIYSTNPLFIKNSRFFDNYADGDGGAIYCKKNVSIKNSAFNNNKADNYGGAIYCFGVVDIQNSIFSDNVADDYCGGAILSRDNVFINNSTFNNNKADNDGGAIYCFGVVDIQSSKFTGNVADDDCGGAIFIRGDEYAGNDYSMIVSCVFSNNKCDDCGGAVYIHNETVFFRDSIFNENFADNSGGAISTIENSQVGYPIEPFVNIENCNFTGNVADDRLGGAIYCQNTLILSACNFYSNSADDGGGAVYAFLLSMSYMPSIFKDNKVDATVRGFGGAIYADYMLTPIIQNAIFSNNYARDGGAIFICDWTLNLENCTFDNNYATHHGGAVDIGITPDNNDGLVNLYVNNCKFNDNIAENHGGAIHTDKAMELNVNNSIFSNNKAYDPGIMYSYGGAIYSFSEKTLIENSFFNNNYADDDGGAIYSEQYLEVKNCSFSKNSAEIDGGAIYAEKKSVIINSEFTENRACGAKFSRCFGGAIRANDLITVYSSNFTKNYADDRGGAIYACDDGCLILNGYNNFIGNGADNYGGALYISSFEEPVSNAIFKDNYVNTDDGGAIYLTGFPPRNAPLLYRGSFTSCVFINNHCGDEGGAIYDKRSTSRYYLKNNIFANNKADDKGQDIYNHGLYEEVGSNWYGENNPDLTDKFKKFVPIISDDEFKEDNYVNIRIKINDTKIYAGNLYKVSIYFVGHDGGSNFGSMYGFDASFTSENCKFLNKKIGNNEVTTEVFFTKSGLATVTGRMINERLKLEIPVMDKYPTSVKITSCDSVIYPNTVIANFEIKNRTISSYVLTDSLGNIISEGNIEKDVNSLSFENLTSQHYTLTIYNEETWDHAPSKATKDFLVKTIVNASITANTVTYGTPTKIILTSDLDGIYTVKFNDRFPTEIEVINGTGVKEIILNANKINEDYTTKTTNQFDYNVVNCSETTFRVNKAGIVIELYVNDTTYPNNITGEILTNTPGNYILWIEGDNSEIIKITNTSYKFNKGPFDAGKYSVIVRSLIKDDYNQDREEVTVNVDKGNIELSVEFVNPTTDKEVIAVVHSSIDGIYKVKIDKFEKEVNVVNGVGKASLLLLKEGSYNATVEFSGDKNHKPYTNTTTFVVKKPSKFGIDKPQVMPVPSKSKKNTTSADIKVYKVNRISKNTNLPKINTISKNIKASKEDTVFVAQNKVISQNEFSKGYNYKIVLKSKSGDALANKKVILIINVMTLIGFTDENGTVYFNLTGNLTGLFNITIIFEGDEYYNPVTEIRTIKIEPL